MEILVYDELIIKRSFIYRQLEEKYNKLKKVIKKTIERKDYTRKRKSFYDSSTKNQNNFKNEMKTSMKFSSQLANAVGLKIRKIIVAPMETPETEANIEIFIEKKNDASVESKELSKASYIKDKSNISDATYQSLITHLGLKLFSLRKIRNNNKRLNEMIVVKENDYGYFINIKQKLKIILKLLIEKNMVTFANNIIYINLAGDSTNIYQGNKTLLISFSILNEKRSNTAYGTYIIGIFSIKEENYECIQKCVEQIKEQYFHLNSIKIGKKRFSIEKYIGGDWKFLALVKGIMAANSNIPCQYCHCHKHFATSENYKDVQYSITDKFGNNRTLSKAKMYVKEGKKTHGYIENPIFDFIEFLRSIPDVPHMFLRVTGKISKLFYKKCQEQDGFKNTKNAENYIGFLQEMCGISNALARDSKTGKLKLRDLKGEEYEQISEHIEFLSDGFKTLENIEALMNIWKGFFDILKKIKMDELTSEDIKLKTLEWFGVFLSVYSNKDVTPYIHTFVYHMHEFHEMLSKINLKINQFSLQGVEKKNDLVTSQYYRGTNRHFKKCLKFILLKNNRIDFLSLEQIQP